MLKVFSGLLIVLSIFLSIEAHAITQKRVVHMVKKMDVNGDQRISYSEFTRAARIKFAKWDKDKDASIGESDLKNSKERIGHMLRSMDLNHNKEISFSEFMKSTKSKFLRLDKNSDGVVDRLDLK